MNKYLYLLLVNVFVSCSSEKETEGSNAETFNFSYTIDTLNIDPGDHFLFLSQNLGSSDLSPDSKYLFNFNAKTFEMEIVDLDQLKLIDIVQLEQEGPNGIGTSPYFSEYKALSKNEFMFASWDKITKIDLPTNKAVYYSLKKEELPPGALASNEELKPGGIISSDGSTFYSWYGEQDRPFDNAGFARIDLESLEVKVIPLPQLEKLDQFAIEVNREDGFTGKFGETISLLDLEDRIIIQPSPINEFWVIDKSTLEVSVKSYISNLTPNIKQGNFPRKVSTREAHQNAMKEMSKEVSFFSLLHDPKRNMIWRITSDFDHMDGEKIMKNYYFTFFDMDLNQLGEFQLENWQMTGKPFIKDGDYYQFINIEDEMAFIRLKPKFEEN